MERLVLGWVLKLCLVEILKMKFDQDLCLNLWYNSTLGSVVPLAMFLLKCWVWWKGGACRVSANNFLLCTDPQRHGEAGGSDSYDRHLVNGLLTSCLCGAFQVSFCTFRIFFTSHYHLQGWGSSSDGAEKIFCNSPNKLKTENVNVDFVTLSSIVEGWKYIWSCFSMVLDKPGHS